MVVRQSNVSIGLRPFFGIVLAAAGTVAMVATALAFLGGLWWAFDILANLRLLLAVALILLAIAFGLGFGRGTTVLFIAAAVVNGALVLPLWLSSQPEALGQETLRIVTFDVGRDAAHRGEIISWLQTTDADLVLLQDATPAWAEALSASGLPHGIYGAPDAAAASGIIVLSTVPVATEVVVQPTTDQSLVEVRLTFAGRPLTVLAARAAPTAGSSDAADRDAFFEQLAARSTRIAESGSRFAIAGNLSTTRWTHLFGRLDAGVPMRNSEDGSGYQATWPTLGIPLVGSVVGIPIDHVLMAESLTTIERNLGPDLGVAHRPLVVTIAPADI